jgi:two-component system catabolic regulation response regulator CreB/two-component system response regulator ChvI
MKKKDDKVKVAFMTAFDIYENEFNKVFKNTSVMMFFKKPVSVNQMIAKIKEAIEKP